MKQQTKGFDYRMVHYEDIHSIEEADFTSLLEIIKPEPFQKIFEGCAGYGAVAKRIYDVTHHMTNQPELFLLDESEVQLEQAKKIIPIVAEHFITGDIRNCPFVDNFFDTVVVKMGIHEIPFDEQKKAMKEIFRILKPGGKFVMWELALDHETQPIFQDIMKKKNELAGFEIINQNRYLQRLDELYLLYESAGFVEIGEGHKILSPLESIKRLDELVSRDRKLIAEERNVDVIDEIALNMIAGLRLMLLNFYIRRRIPEHMRERFEYKDWGNNIRITVPKMIMVGYKPT